MNSDLFICSHTVDRSLLAQGFAQPGAMLVDFTSWFGAVSPGDSRDITIRLDGTSHAVRLGNRNFDRVKWADHGEMYQMRYNPAGTFAKTSQAKFSATQKFIADELLRHPDLGKKHIKVPAAQRGQIVFYRTDDPCAWDAEVQTAAESRDVLQSVGTLDEPPPHRPRNPRRVPPYHQILHPPQRTRGAAEGEFYKVIVSSEKGIP